MKIIEKVIKYDDYNYVEGTLQFKAYGRTTKRLAHSEFFSIEYISSVRFKVEKRYLAPELPPGINKNKVSTLNLPEKITTIVDGDYNKPFNITFDEIIVDDDFLDINQNIVGRRFFTVKEGTQISSTVEIKVYGLIKIAQDYIEKTILYEVYTTAHGLGTIEVHPKKDGYLPGELLKIRAVPQTNQQFRFWGADFIEHSEEFEVEIGESDLYIDGFFTELNSDPIPQPPPKPIPSPQLKPIGKQVRSLVKEAQNKFNNPIYTNEKIGVKEAGCGELIGWGLGIIFYGFILLLFIALLGKYFFILAAIVLVIYLLSLIPTQIFSWRILRWLLGLGFIFILLTGLVNISDNFKTYKRDRTERVNPIPISEEVKNENSTIDYVHEIRWKDYSDEWYETKLVVNSDIVESAKNYRNFQPTLNSTSDYNSLLSKLYQKSQRDAYFRVTEKLDSIKSARNFGDIRFAEVIVSMVQSIPYYAIVEQTCNPLSYRDPMIRDLLVNNPCQPFVRHGIKAPAEFLKDLKGDCDTRTLFLYGLLKAKGFNVAIFGSQKYGHSLLGISLPINGRDYKIINTKRYYLWEVTAKDFKPGFLPPNINDLRYWELNLN